MKIAQDQKYQGDDWWDWSVRLDASPAELKNVASVTWHLHPTFEQKDVKTDDSANHFALETSGWGTFPVRATITLKNGKTKKLTHELELTYPDGV